jgi:hypothetical protein
MAHGGVEVQLHSFLTSAVEKGEQTASHPGDLTPQKKSKVPREYEAGWPQSQYSHFGEK